MFIVGIGSKGICTNKQSTYITQGHFFSNVTCHFNSDLVLLLSTKQAEQTAHTESHRAQLTLLIPPQSKSPHHCGLMEGLVLLHVVALCYRDNVERCDCFFSFFRHITCYSLLFTHNSAVETDRKTPKSRTMGIRYSLDWFSSSL